MSMPNAPLVRRVEILEEKVDALSQSPERVSAIEKQLVVVRDELKSFRDEFTSRAEFTSFRTEVRAEIRAGDEETRHQLRVPREDVVSRIALLQEGIDRRNGRSGRSTRTPPNTRA